MLILYRQREDPVADELVERLRELVLAHRVILVDDGRALPDGSMPIAWPVLTEGSGARYEGADAIQAFLDALAYEVTLNRQFQSDACYLDPDDPDHCL
ncbi:MAG: hypothetical protein Q9M35_04390 [Rhodothermus sp.]|nr:hypothetical protein [Rhodothermus sp.]